MRPYSTAAQLLTPFPIALLAAAIATRRTRAADDRHHIGPGLYWPTEKACRALHPDDYSDG